jgi:hypothetical protein
MAGKLVPAHLSNPKFEDEASKSKQHEKQLNAGVQ